MLNTKRTIESMESINYISDSLPISQAHDNYDSIPGHETPIHWHNEFELLMVTNGAVECKMWSEDNQIMQKVFTKGEGAFFNSRAIHQIRSILPDSTSKSFHWANSFFNFQPSGSIYKNIILPMTQLSMPGIFLTLDNPAGNNLLICLKEFFEADETKPEWELHCIETVCYTWRHLLMITGEIKKSEGLPGTSFKKDRVWTMLSYVHKNYRNDITIDDIAASANVSKSECFRCFHEVVHKTPMQYLTDYRITQAAAALINTEDSIYDISINCGVSSSSYFGSVFKKEMKCSPTQYRKQFST